MKYMYVCLEELNLLDSYQNLKIYAYDIDKCLILNAVYHVSVFS